MQHLYGFNGNILIKKNPGFSLDSKFHNLID